MRLMLPTVALVLSSACGYLDGGSVDWYDDTAYPYASGTIYAATRGVAVSDNGTHGAAGMGGAACEVQSDWMGVGADYLEGENPRVVDALGDEFLVLTDDQVFVFDGSLGVTGFHALHDAIEGQARHGGGPLPLQVHRRQDRSLGFVVSAQGLQSPGGASPAPGETFSLRGARTFSIDLERLRG